MPKSLDFMFILLQSILLFYTISCNFEMGKIKKDLRLSDRTYKCECGNVIDRDFQASLNLIAYGEQFAS